MAVVRLFPQQLLFGHSVYLLYFVTFPPRGFGFILYFWAFVTFSAEFLGVIFKGAALFENLKTPIAYCLTMLIRFELLFFADLP